MSNGLRLSVLLGEASLIHTIKQIQACCQQSGFPGPTSDEPSLGFRGWGLEICTVSTIDP